MRVLHDSMEVIAQSVIYEYIEEPTGSSDDADELCYSVVAKYNNGIDEQLLMMIRSAHQMPGLPVIHQEMPGTLRFLDVLYDDALRHDDLAKANELALLRAHLMKRLTAGLIQESFNVNFHRLESFLDDVEKLTTLDPELNREIASIRPLLRPAMLERVRLAVIDGERDFDKNSDWDDDLSYYFERENRDAVRICRASGIDLPVQMKKLDVLRRWKAFYEAMETRDRTNDYDNKMYFQLTERLEAFEPSKGNND